LTTLEAPASQSIQEQKRFIKRATQFYVQNNKLWKRRTNQSPTLVILEKNKRLIILHQAHEDLGHKGEQATFDTIRERFYWPHLRMDVKHHVQSCHPCQIRSTKKMVLPPTVSMPATIFTKIYVDCMVMNTTKEGYRYIVTARDDLTRAAESRALKNCNSSALRKFFWEQIYCRYGAIGHVVTDNGAEVKGAFTELMEKLNIPRIQISTYNKTANGVVERGNFTLREAIINSCKVRTDWPKKIAIATFANQISISGVTEFSAYYLLHGVHPILPFDLTESTFQSQSFTSGMSTEDILVLRIRQLSRHEEDIALASENLRNARFRSKEQFERRYRKRLARRTYKPGSLVLVRNLRIELEHGRKTKPRYLGPYEVVRQTRGGSYILMEMVGHIGRQGYAAFRLLPYITCFNKKALQKLLRDKPEENSDDNDDDYFDDSDDNLF
jgi:transposase InsO family protein